MNNLRSQGRFFHDGRGRSMKLMALTALLGMAGPAQAATVDPPFVVVVSAPPATSTHVGGFFEIPPWVDPNDRGGGFRMSKGLRHPHGLKHGDYLYVFYVDTSVGFGSRGPGIKVARSPVSQAGMPGSWESYCETVPGQWTPSLPAGFNKTNLSAFYGQQGGCSTPLIGVHTGGDGLTYLDGGLDQGSFAVAATVQGRFFGIEELINENGSNGPRWQLRLWSTSDLIHWSLVQVLRDKPRDPVAAQELHYPVFLSADGWRSDLIDENDFYVLGSYTPASHFVRIGRTQDGSNVNDSPSGGVKAMHVHTP